jgi:hypothetical protein
MFATRKIVLSATIIPSTALAWPQALLSRTHLEALIFNVMAANRRPSAVRRMVGSCVKTFGTAVGPPVLKVRGQVRDEAIHNLKFARCAETNVKNGLERRKLEEGLS